MMQSRFLIALAALITVSGLSLCTGQDNVSSAAALDDHAVWGVLGACCQLDGSCSSVTSVECSAINGFYGGDGVACSGLVCPLRLTASDASSRDRYGSSVAIDGDTAVIGAPLRAHGAAYVYARQENGSWLEVAVLTAENSQVGNEFGAGVAVEGMAIVVGAPEAKRAYVFYRDQGGPGAWGQVAELQSDVGTSERIGFGKRVAISDGTILVRAGGVASIFERDQGGVDAWGRVVNIAFGQFAISDSDLSGSTVVLGSYFDSQSCFHCGAAYVYMRDQGGPNAWGQVAKILAGDGEGDDQLGKAVALDGDLVVLGAHQNTTSGSAYVFARDHGGDESWGQVAKLTLSGTGGGDLFGSDVSVSGTTVIVGALFGLSNDAGSAYVYHRDSDGPDRWGQVAVLTAPDGSWSDRFGVAVAVDGNAALVGSKQVGGTGHAYLFSELPVSGACCLGGGFCAQVEAARCADLGGVYGGDLSVCVDGGCPVTAVLSDQTANPASSLTLTQDFEPAGDVSDSEAADDFTVSWPAGWDITSVAVDGETWGGPKTPAAMNVTIFADSGGGPGSPVCTYAGADLTSDLAGRYLVSLDPVCSLPSGTFWLDAQARMDFVDGLYGWVGRSTQTGSAAVWRNPGDGLGTGCTDWTTGCNLTAPDLIFQVLGNCVGGSCPGQVGACCADDGSCTAGPAAACVGRYQGDGTTCFGARCRALGACCRLDGGCSEVPALECTAPDGLFHGEGSSCATTSCVLGACCENGEFCHDTTAALCTAGGGTYGGNYSACRDLDCAGTRGLWSQISSPTSAAVTQDFEPAANADDSEGADDFDVSWPAGWEITSAVLGTALWNGHGPLESMDITIHADGGGVPGSVLCSYQASTFVDDRDGHVMVPFDPSCTLPLGSYWIAGQGRMTSAGGFFGWALEPVQTGNPGVWRNPGNGLATGCTDWTAGCSMSAPDYSFSLQGRCVGGDCPNQVGACCAVGGTCSVETLDACNLAGGAYRGDGTTCEIGLCVPEGACCRFGGCLEQTSSGCAADGGAYQGDGSSCVDAGCPVLPDAKLLPSDGNYDGRFGAAVAIDNSIAVIGSFRDDDNGVESGAAFVFYRTTAGWQEVAKLTADDAAEGDLFGASVAISSSTIVVGAPEDRNRKGSAYVFERHQGGPDNWGQSTKLTGNDVTWREHFGFSSTIDGDTLVIGAPGSDGYGSGRSAYVFDRDQGGVDAWGLVTRISSPDNGDDQEFGKSVDLDDDTLIVGEPLQYKRAHVYRRHHDGANAWGKVRTLNSSDLTFGRSVALEGDIAVVAAPGAQDGGSVRVYSRDLGGPDNWGFVTELSVENAGSFGVAMDLAGATVVIGAPGEDGLDTNTGAAYVFSRDEGGIDAWGRVVRLTAADSEGGDQYGADTAVSGAVAVVGTPYDDDVTSVHTGSAWVVSELPVTGACCLAGGVCSETLADRCAAWLGSFAGEQTTCEEAVCPVTGLLYDQTSDPAPSVALSQDFELANDTSDCEGADDFVVDWPQGWQVEHVVVDGFSWSGASAPESMNVSILADAGGLPGAALCSYPVAPFAYQREGRFLMSLQPACSLATGSYWLSVQGRLDAVNGRFGWTLHDLQVGSPGVWRNPGDALVTGCTDWTVGCSMAAPDYSFQLLGSCVGGDCPDQVGACCKSDGSCSDGTPAACSNAGGRYHGDGTSCVEVTCGTFGACCTSDGSCVEVSPASCMVSDGVYHGDGSTCAATACTFGACCQGAGFCHDTTVAGCAASDGTWHGDDSACRDVECPIDAVLWNQISTPAGTTLVQDFESSFDNSDCEGADDFEVAAGGWAVSSVLVHGSYFNGHGPLGGLTVTVHGDAGGTPGAVLCSYPEAGYVEDHGGRFLVRLNPPCELSAGTHWVATQGRMNAAEGSFGWDVEPLLTGAAGVWRNPEDGFATGCIDWTAGCAMPGPDFAFQLVGDCVGGACPTGACCQSEGTCAEVTAAGCMVLGGRYQGDGITCQTAECGACCFTDGSCLANGSGACQASGGVHSGTGSVCTAMSCPLFSDDFTSGDTSAWTWRVQSLADAFNVFLSERGIGGEYVACSYDEGDGDYSYLGQGFNEANGGLGGVPIDNFGDLYWKNEELASTVAPYSGEDPDGDGAVSAVDTDSFDPSVQ